MEVKIGIDGMTEEAAADAPAWRYDILHAYAYHVGARSLYAYTISQKGVSWTERISRHMLRRRSYLSESLYARC